jgi:stage III sporulation protein AC
LPIFKGGIILDIGIVFKIAGIGILTAVLHSVLKSFGKEDQAHLATLAGVTVVLFMVIQLLSGLFDYVRSVFSLY